MADTPEAACEAISACFLENRHKTRPPEKRRSAALTARPMPFSSPNPPLAPTQSEAKGQRPFPSHLRLSASRTGTQDREAPRVSGAWSCGAGWMVLHEIPIYAPAATTPAVAGLLADTPETACEAISAFFGM